MYDVELADNRNQLDVKIDSRQACVFSKHAVFHFAPCSILPRLTIYIHNLTKQIHYTNFEYLIKEQIVRFSNIRFFEIQITNLVWYCDT